MVDKSLLAAYIGGPVAKADQLGQKVGSSLVPYCIHRVNSRNGYAIDIVTVIIIIMHL